MAAADPRSVTKEAGSMTKDGKQNESGTRRQAVDPKLLEFLVCPVSHTTLSYDAKAGELISKAAGLAYPIRDGIPIMLEDEARQLDDTL